MKPAPDPADAAPGTAPTRSSPRPELLAPAGDWECARAAVENGADAVYFGLERFNARLRARNFTEADLPELMAWLHTRGVRAYVTFNTLVFTRELEEAEDHLRAIISAGADAVIVQDVGVCRLVRRLSPDFPIHASTQMTITSAAGVEFARELGCELVVLARENSLREIAQIRESLAASGAGLPLEVFVHGALCVAYSGQCLTSEALGGRSANRGECAQACRLPYELLADGVPVDLGDRRYLLSPQDLAGLDLLPELARAGVASLKIEGRLKSPEYVASITRIYRQALDRLETAGIARANEPSGSDRHEMEMAFSRGLYTGWLGGIDNQRLVHGWFGTRRGPFAGRVTRVEPDRVWLRPESPLHAGDGVVFEGAPEQREEGGRLFAVTPGRNGELALTFLPRAVDIRRIRPGQRVWKTSDPRLERTLRQSFEGQTPRRTAPVHAAVAGSAGEPLTLTLHDEGGCSVRLESAMTLVPAERHPLDTERLREQLGRLGGTPFHLASLRNDLEGAVMLPLGELNRLRREAVAQIAALRAHARRWTLLPREPGSPAWRIAVPAGSAGVPSSNASTPAQLRVLARTMAQAEAAIASEVRSIVLDFENPRAYRDAVARLRREGVEIAVAPPRVFKPGEDWILRQVRAAEADVILARNYDHFRAFRDMPMDGDFSLNIANPLAAEHYVRRLGLRRLTPSYDLNAAQLEDLLKAAPPDWFEVTIHQHMPMFHMEHCVFCAFLSTGRDYRDCGRPCDHRVVHLRDRAGAVHPVKADAGCRNTVFNARAQTGAEHVQRLLLAGGRRFRLDFLDESPEDVRRLIDAYGRLLRGEISGEALWREFRLVNQLGVTRGQLGRASGADLGVNRWAEGEPAGRHSYSRPRSSRSISSSPR